MHEEYVRSRRSGGREKSETRGRLPNEPNDSSPLARTSIACLIESRCSAMRCPEIHPLPAAQDARRNSGLLGLAFTRDSYSRDALSSGSVSIARFALFAAVCLPSYQFNIPSERELVYLRNTALAILMILAEFVFGIALPIAFKVWSESTGICQLVRFEHNLRILKSLWY